MSSDILLGLISTAILLIIALIHFRSHFSFDIKGKKLVIPRQTALAFYPSLWTLYLIYLLFLSITIVLLHIFNINHYLLRWSVSYGIILSSCWESLFSFHRYCTLRQFQRRSKKIKTRSILKRFAWFASVWISLFLMQLQFLYWLFPIIIIMYISFNIFWQYQFVQMLLKQYSTLASLVDIIYLYIYMYFICTANGLNFNMLNMQHLTLSLLQIFRIK